MKKIISATVFVLLISVSFYSQDNCKAEDKERAKLIAQKIELGSRIKFAVENNDFGDCVHYTWMDEMRKLGIKRVAAVLRFVWKDKIEKLEITKISFSQTYEEFNPESEDKKLLKQIETSGLKKHLEDEILERAKKHVFILIESLEKNYKEGLLKKEPKGKITGTLFHHLLDDEVLPVFVGMPIIEF